KGRGISPDTIEHAEKAGMVRYADGGVLFVGYDRTGTVCIAHHARLLGVLDGVRADAPALEVVAAMLAGCQP
ncbi:DUF3991 domain-containing protein, partial [Aeromonas caviae]|uniref:DUF3991 domain-containing protein n=1 Tax=Aeromonas caviae TaxID=648 RepID=UPI001CC35CF3